MSFVILSDEVQVPYDSQKFLSGSPGTSAFNDYPVDNTRSEIQLLNAIIGPASDDMSCIEH